MLWGKLGLSAVAAWWSYKAEPLPRRLDFRAILAVAAAHRWQVEHRCGERLESCLPCGLGALRLGNFKLTRCNRRAALHLAFPYRRALLHDCQAREGCTRCALDGLGSSDPATRTNMTTLLDLWEQDSPARRPSPTGTTPVTP